MSEYALFSLFIGVKVLLFTTKPSTDFEVHRNWKAITTSLPIRSWYYENTSKWTLDYPPLFAYMEFLLGTISKYIDPKITMINNLNYDSKTCIYFQRATVLFGDILLLYALKKLGRGLKLTKGKFLILLAAIQAFSGLILVDNMHFQYNTLLFSVFFLSIAYISNEQYIMGAILFILSVCFKHLFLYMAPAFLVFYLQFYIFSNKRKRFCKIFISLFKVGFTIVMVLALVFSPFIYISYVDRNFDIWIQIFNRLFPFQRGLLHTYWAPNFWALYSFVDKLLFFIRENSKSIGTYLGKFNIPYFWPKDGDNVKLHEKTNKTTLGLTQPSSFDILPNISPSTPLIIIFTILTLYFTCNLILRSTSHLNLSYNHKQKSANNQTIKLSPINIRIEKTKKLIRYCIFSNLIFFNFGYQVHEKAFILISLLAIIHYIISIHGESSSKNDVINRLAYLIVIIGSLSMMPLINDFRDYLPKVFIFLSYLALVRSFVMNDRKCVKEKVVYVLYVAVALVLDFNEVFKSHFNYNLFGGNNKTMGFIKDINERYPFLGLMLFSVINAIMVQVCVFVLIWV